MTLDEILINYNNGKYTYEEPFLRLIDSTYILDKNISVEENRKLLKEYNEQAMLKNNEIRSIRVERKMELGKDSIAYLQEKYNFTWEQAFKLYVYVVDNHYDFSITDYLNELRDLGELISDILKLQ